MNRSYEMQPVQTVEVLPKNQWEEEALAVKDNAYALAATDAFCDMLRAGLTKQAMDNTAVLAKFEEHYNSIAPTGSASTASSSRPTREWRWRASQGGASDDR